MVVPDYTGIPAGGRCDRELAHRLAGVERGGAQSIVNNWNK